MEQERPAPLAPEVGCNLFHGIDLWAGRERKLLLRDKQELCLIPFTRPYPRKQSSEGNLWLVCLISGFRCQGSTQNCPFLF